MVNNPLLLLFEDDNKNIKPLKEKMFCKICNQQTKYSIDVFSQNHLRKIHNINMKQYYDMYFKKENEGKCAVCGNATTYYRFSVGYAKCCSHECVHKDPDWRKSVSDSYKYRDMKKENKKRKQTRLERYGNENYYNTKKAEETCIKKYGVSNCFAIPIVKEKRDIALEKNKDEINQKRRDSWTDEKIEVANNIRRETNLEKYGYENVFQSPIIRDKIETSCLEKYNTLRACQSKEVKDKIKQTNLEKYGTTCSIQGKEAINKAKETSQRKYSSDYYLGSKIRKQKMEDSGKWRSAKDKPEYQKYSELVWKETRKWVKQLFKNWDGMCYYTNVKLSTDKTDSNNKLYRVIEHKTSIFYGFKNNIDPNIVGNIDNLCICSKSANNRKCSKCEHEFKDLLKKESLNV